MSSFSNNSLTRGSLEVIDPCNRTGKIVIPLQYIEDTRGINEQNRPRESKDLSLCLLYQKGRCNAGLRCHQIHADPVFVNKLRAQASAGTACCALHGDFQSSSYLTIASKTVEVYTNGVAALYPIIAFGRTAAFDTLLASAGSTIRLNSNKICRLHTEGRCKFGRDCKNVHLCPKAKAAGSPTKPAPLEPFTRPNFSKAAVHLDVSRSELETSSFCGMSSCPDTPDLGKSLRSASCASTVASIPSAASSPDVSPKEFGLMNRSAAEDAPLPRRLFSTPPPAKLSPLAIQPAAAPLSASASLFDSLLSMPMLTCSSAASPSNVKSCPEFELTASLIAADLAAMTISPSWSLTA